MMRLPRRTARVRLTALYGGLFLVSGVALVAATYLLFQRATDSTPPRLPAIPHAPAVHRLQLPLALAYALPRLEHAQHQLARDQQLVIRPPGSPSARGVPPLPVVPLAQDERQLTRDRRRLTLAAHELARAVHQVAQTGSVEAAQRRADSHRLLVDSGVALAVVGVLALLAGWLVAGRMLRPIRTITRTARRISSASLDERLALAGPEDELKELGDTLDDLFARLEAAFEAQRRFVAHASHELRTPLTRERALVQVALGDPATSELWRATGQALLASNRGQERLIDALLTLASSERGLDRREPADLSAIADAILLDRRDAVRSGGLRLEATVAPAPVDGDPRLLESLVANLVDNAIAHNVDGGRVEVVTADEDGAAVLRVANTGPVIPAGELERLFQPFQRLDPHRTRRGGGHGLGLSIVRAIAVAHGATVEAHPRPGGGVSVEVAFPRVARPVAALAAPTPSARATCL